MLFLIEIDSVEIETDTPSEAARQAILSLRNHPAEIRLTVTPHDPDEHGPAEDLEIETTKLPTETIVHKHFSAQNDGSLSAGK